MPTSKSKLKTCKTCGHIYELKSYPYKSRIIYRPCPKCENKRLRNKHKERKLQITNLMGGKCHLCGYDKNYAALELHHVNPKDKEYPINKLKSVSWKLVIKELSKCILVCSNCHREIHNPTTKYNDKEKKFISIKSLMNKDIKKTGICPICNEPTYKTTYCSPICGQIGRRKVNRPRYNDLLNDVMNLTKTQISKKYNVSDKTITKWMNVMHIPNIFNNSKNNFKKGLDKL